MPDPKADLETFATQIDENVLASDFSDNSKRKARKNEAQKSQ